MEDLKSEYERYKKANPADSMTFDDFRRVHDFTAQELDKKSKVNLDLVTQRSALDEVSTDESNKALDAVLTNHRIDLKAVLIAASRRKISRISRLFDYVESLEAKLSVFVDSDKLMPHDILMLYRDLKASLDRDLTFINTTSDSLTVPRMGTSGSTDNDAMTRESRIRIQQLVQSLERRILKAEETTVGQAQPYGVIPVAPETSKELSQ